MFPSAHLVNEGIATVPLGVFRKVVGSSVSPEEPLPTTTRRFRGPLLTFTIALVVGFTSYAISPTLGYGAGGYPGPDALPSVPTYGSYLGTIPIGGHSPVSYVCGFDAPNATNHSPKNAIAEINGHISAYLPISTQFGCAEFVVYVSLTNGVNQAPCGFAYASVNGGTWILVSYGVNYLLISGIKHYRHVAAYFPFTVPPPAVPPAGCATTTTTTSTTIPVITTTTVIHNQTTTTSLHATTTLPGFHTTTSNYNAGSTSTIPTSLNNNPGTVIHTITQIITLIAIIIAAGAAAAGIGQFFVEVPEALVEEYTTEIPPGGGLPYNLFPSGGSGTADEESVLATVQGASTDIPPGGGYALGGEAPEGTVADEYTAQMAGRSTEENPELFNLDEDEVPPAGGAPMDELSENTGGIEDSSTDEAPSSGGTA